MHEIEIAWQDWREEELDDVTIKCDRLPSECPVCYRNIIPMACVAVFRSERKIQIVFQCVAAGCRMCFFCDYSRLSDGTFEYIKIYSKHAPRVEFSEIVQQTSPDFIEIFTQAHIAESQGLDQINGIGLRKALEFLIKDFIISESDDMELHERVLSKSLASCISEFIDDSRLKSVAKRAAWLGNDEAHYIRRWKDNDVEDLKRLIKLTVNWIENVVLTREFESSMPD